MDKDKLNRELVALAELVDDCKLDLLGLSNGIHLTTVDRVRERLTVVSVLLKSLARGLEKETLDSSKQEG